MNHWIITTMTSTNQSYYLLAVMGLMLSATYRPAPRQAMSHPEKPPRRESPDPPRFFQEHASNGDG
jgi:hypothetical protein